MEDKDDNSNKIKNVISHHIFMFPFMLKTEYSNDLKSKVEEEGWQYKIFDFENNKIEARAKYSEYVYFHNYVKQTLFNRKSEENNISLYFEKPIPENATLVIDIKDVKTYVLKISHISLRLFDTSVGIMTIELENFDYPSFNDVLIINDFGRRIYPQFVDEKKGIEATKDAFLANKIILNFGGDKIEENFEEKDFIQMEVKVANYIEYLLGKTLKPPNITPIIDDRMFVLCWFGDDEFSNKLSSKMQTSEYLFEYLDEWYKFIFVDGKNIGIANKIMQKELVKASTYSRWADYGTLFGLSRYSFVCLTDRSDISYNIIRNHMQRMYYQMAILLLAQRASMLKFSNDIANITTRVKQSKNKYIESKTFSDVKKLYSSFIRFENMLNFIEVTPQEQGIEMYKMAYRNMGLEEMMNKLRYELDKLHQFVELQYSKESSRNISKLQTILSILPVSLASILVNYFIPEAYRKIGFIIIGSILFLGFLVYIKWPCWPFNRREGGKL